MVIIGKDEYLYKNHNFTFLAYEKYITKNIVKNSKFCQSWCILACKHFP